ncbi:MAG TPA: hypothetical protein VIT92_14500 [Burkholderiaceae bacterium]
MLDAEKWQFPTPVLSRPDTARRAVVDRAIQLQRDVGTGAAARALAAVRLPLDTALRVLLKPAARRATD